MEAAPLPPVEVVRRRLRPGQSRSVAPLAHSTNSPVNQQQVLWLSLPPTRLPPAALLQRSPPSLSEGGVWPTQKAASEWKWATTLSSLPRLNPSPQKIMVSSTRSLLRCLYCGGVYHIYLYEPKAKIIQLYLCPSS